MRSLAPWLALCLAAACAPAPRAEPAQRFAPAGAAPARDDETPRQAVARAPQIEALFAEAFAEKAWPGLAVGLVSHAGLVWSRGFGVTDLASGGPVTVDTVFRVGSLTKTVTGLALLSLRDQSKLRLDDPVDAYLPELAAVVYPTRDSPRITLRHIVTQTSGLSRDGLLPGLRAGGHVPTEAELLATLAGQALASAPGSTWLYSNQAAAIAGLVVERVSGEAYTAFVERTLLAPLGMTRSGFAPRPEWGSALATGYVAADAGWRVEPLTPHGATAATGHLYASLADLARYVAFELDAWPPRDDPERGPVRRSTVRESQRVAGMQEPKAEADAVFWVTELGPGGVPWVSHGGTIDGFHALVLFAPRKDLGLVALTNVREPAGLDALARRAFATALGAGEADAAPALPSP